MKQISYADFAQQRESEGYRLIDVREPDEYAQVHVKGAELFPLSKLRQGELPEQDDRPLALICRSGGRSAMAAQILESQGFPEVTNVQGGTAAAVQAGPDHVES